jgi:hypothetical protein
LTTTAMLRRSVAEIEDGTRMAMAAFVNNDGGLPERQRRLERRRRMTGL